MINPLYSGKIPAGIPAKLEVQPQGVVRYLFEEFAKLGGGTNLKSPKDMFVKSVEEPYFYTLNA